MPDKEIELKPVDRFTCDAIGQPGSRTFFIQASGTDSQFTFLVEKVQLQSLALGIGEFLEDVYKRYPDLEHPLSQVEPTVMAIRPPVDPQFRVGDLGLAYAEDEDLAVLQIREIMTGQAAEEDLRIVRLWLTRAQLVIFSNWSKIIVSRGRKICPQCGEPEDPSGHLCPKKNGHKK